MQKLKSFLLVTLFSSVAVSVHSQYSESIRTGRPGASIGSHVIGAKVVQVQSGYNFASTSGTPDFQMGNFNNVLRLGLSERTEISAVFNHNSFTVGNNSISGFGPIQVGGRVNVLESNGNAPAVGIQARLVLPKKSGDYQNSQTDLLLMAAATNAINEVFSYGVNLGLNLYGNNNTPGIPYALNLGIGINEKWGTFVEIFGDLNASTTGFDTGLSYLVNNDFQLDISAGVQSGTFNTRFVDFGFSWRCDWRD